MNEEQRTPEDRVTQNEIICEKLLGWIKRPSDIPGISFSGWCVPNGPDESTPSFATWADAGLILDALAKAGQRPDLGHYRDGEWHCMVNATDDLVPQTFSTGPLAIRDAALAYIEAKTEHESAEGERAEAARDHDWREYYP